MAGNINAQTACTLHVTLADNETTLAVLQLKNSFPTKPACLQYVQQLPAQLATAGYISASVDSVAVDSSSVFILLFTGKKYAWEDVAVDEKDWYVLTQLGFNKTTFHNKPFDNGKVQQVYDVLLDYFANNGYPFAKVGLDSVAINNEGRVTAKLSIDRGFLYHIDGIIVTGNAKLSNNFLFNYLGIKPGNVYQQDKIDKINQRLAELPYVEQAEPWRLTMLNTGAVINIAI
ncbi:MAG TPA: POTRA domain-containing protein, partial [Chitinophagaceae bacterium]|nr:POTRA domain-containing protein [Chitinophagaceae bacterium]